MINIEDVVGGTPYAGYLYSYPHKTAYRPIDPPPALREVWADENKAALSLYLHVPFCEMRCGFCNLFTAARPKDQVVDAYLAQLEVQAEVVARAIGPEAKFARLAIGGGTPTYLEAAALERVFDLAEGRFGAIAAQIPSSVETSPETATRERLRVLARRGVSRISIGVQSFVESECAAIARPQRTALVHAALDAIRSEAFLTLNIDLMYGLPSQSRAMFERSLRAALLYRPEELYLYPLYVRPLTGLGRMGKSWDDQRLELYRFGRSLLLAEGYRQVSMRMFRAASAPECGGPVHCCQTDGMIGLGPGARSYASGLHYSNEYAVSARGVKEIIADWNSRARDAFAHADYGVALDGEEQRRRYVILSLLADGLDVSAYRSRFGTDPIADIPQLEELIRFGLAAGPDRTDLAFGGRTGARISLTPLGVERSDAVGPYLHSKNILIRMEDYQVR